VVVWPFTSMLLHRSAVDRTLLNMLLASGANVHRLRLCWRRRPFWAQAVIEMMCVWFLKK